MSEGTIDWKGIRSSISIGIENFKLSEAEVGELKNRSQGV